MKKEVRIGVSVLLFNKKGQILVGKRIGSHGAGLLSIPGGHIEFGETAFQTCTRELNEEIGVSFRKYIPFDYSEDLFYDDNVLTKHYITLYFVVDNIDSDNLIIQNLEPHKCESWDWTNVSDLPREMFCDTYGKIHDYYTNNL